MRLENSVSPDAQPEHRTAKGHWVNKRSANDIFDNERNAMGDKAISDWADEVSIFALVDAIEAAVFLTRRTCPNEVEAVQREGHRVVTMELKRKVWLRFDIYTHHFVSRTMEPHRRTTSFAKEIKRSHHALLYLVVMGENRIGMVSVTQSPLLVPSKVSAIRLRLMAMLSSAGRRWRRTC